MSRVEVFGGRMLLFCSICKESTDVTEPCMRHIGGHVMVKCKHRWCDEAMVALKDEWGSLQKKAEKQRVEMAFEQALEET